MQTCAAPSHHRPTAIHENIISSAKGGNTIKHSISAPHFISTSQLHVHSTPSNNKRSRWYSIPSMSHLKVNEMNTLKSESWVEISQSFISLPFHSFCLWLYPLAKPVTFVLHAWQTCNAHCQHVQAIGASCCNCTGRVFFVVYSAVHLNLVVMKIDWL